MQRTWPLAVGACIEGDMHPHGSIVAFSPALPGWHAVYATEEGQADFEPIAGWATYRSHHGDRLVAMTRAFGVAAGLQPADIDPYFTGIAAPGERPTHWDLACRQHLDALDALELDAEPLAAQRAAS